MKENWIKAYKDNWKEKYPGDAFESMPLLLGETFITEMSEHGWSIIPEKEVLLLNEHKPFKHRSERERFVLRKNATVTEIVAAANKGEAKEIGIISAEMRGGELVFKSRFPGLTIGKQGKTIKSIQAVAGCRCRVEAE